MRVFLCYLQLFKFYLCLAASFPLITDFPFRSFYFYRAKSLSLSVSFLSLRVLSSGALFLSFRYLQRYNATSNETRRSFNLYISTLYFHLIIKCWRFSANLSQRRSSFFIEKLTLEVQKHLKHEAGMKKEKRTDMKGGRN